MSSTVTKQGIKLKIMNLEGFLQPRKFNKKSMFLQESFTGINIKEHKSSVYLFLGSLKHQVI